MRHQRSTWRRYRGGISFAISEQRSSLREMNRDDREVAMTKTILGSIAVICCGVLLIPLLVDTAPPAGAVPAARQIVTAELR